MKKIYFKENFVGNAKNPNLYELFWKRHRWMPFRKIGDFNYGEIKTLMMNYAMNYEVHIWDSILNEYLSVEEFFA